jgi:prephenate dehydrogenase
MRFGIVGFGRFGQLWANCLLPFGDIFVYDKKSVHSAVDLPVKLTHLKEVAEADIVFILVPISEFKNSCTEIKKVLPPTTLVVDCCSVKLYPVNVMQQVLPSMQPLLPTHPLFGPDSVKNSAGLRDHKIVICPLHFQDTKNSAVNHKTVDCTKQDQLQAIFKQMGLTMLITTPEEHDEQMANSQGLVHFLGRGLEALNLHQQELATPDFEALLKINSMVANDTWQLFSDMHRYNHYTKGIREKLISHLISINTHLEKGEHHA